jgi:ABC-type multidrug transport system ATPase subunit
LFSAHSKAEQVLDVLELGPFRDVVWSEHLALHVKKRVTIGVELVASPRILFLDEPTTGMDALGAEIVVSAVRRATDVFQICTVCTIHQVGFICLMLGTASL